MAGCFRGSALQIVGSGRSPLGLTFAVESHADRIDETTAAIVRNYGTEFTLAFDRDLIPNFAVVALNLIYHPEWTPLSAQARQSRNPPSAPHSERWRNCVRASLSAVKRAICGNTKASVYRNSPGRRCSSGRRPISSCRNAPG